MKNINALIALALFFSYMAKKYIAQFAVGFPKIINKKRKIYLCLKNSYTTE
jgi:hypothetical protein